MKKCLLILLLASTQVLALDAKALLKERMTAVKTLKANFKQMVKQDNRQVISRGYFELQRPSKFRWQVISPQPQLIVSNGSTLWIYDKDLDQVTLRKVSKQQNDTPALFLSGYDDKLAKQYDIRFQRKGALELFYLKPYKEGGSYRYIELGYKNKLIQTLRLEDELGQELRLSFSKQQLNQTINAKQFDFKPPPGVDVVSE